MSSRDQLILDNLKTVRGIAYRIFSRLPHGGGVELDDLVQAGNVGLIQAADKFDESKGVPFRYFACVRIYGAIVDSLRALDGETRKDRRSQKHLAVVARDLEQVLHRRPTTEELSEAGAETGKVYSTTVSLSAHRDDETPNDPECSEDTHPDVMLMQKQAADTVQRLMSVLSPRHRRVIHKLYFDEDSMESVAERDNTSPSNVRRMHITAMEHFNLYLGCAGIQSVSTYY